MTSFQFSKDFSKYSTITRKMKPISENTPAYWISFTKRFVKKHSDVFQDCVVGNYDRCNDGDMKIKINSMKLTDKMQEKVKYYYPLGTEISSEVVSKKNMSTGMLERDSEVHIIIKYNRLESYFSISKIYMEIMGNLLITLILSFLFVFLFFEIAVYN